MKRVTDFSEVEYIVPDGTVLPDDVRDELRHYQSVRVKNTATGQAGYRYRIPRYLMTQWLGRFAAGWATA